MTSLQYIVCLFVLFIVCKKNELEQKPEGNNIEILDTANQMIDANIVDPTDTIEEPEPVIVKTFLYASLDNDNAIAVYTVDTTDGTLALVEKASTVGRVGSLAVSQSKKYLYAAIRSTGEVSSFAIDSLSGKLRNIQTTQVVDNPVYIKPDRTNKYLLTVYYNAGKMAIYPITGDSIIGSTATVIQDTGVNPHCIQTSSDDQFLYVPARGSDFVLQFQFNPASGTVTAMNPDKVITETGAGPRHLTFHPSKSIMYVVNENNCAVSAYNMDANGLLTNFQNISTLPASFTDENTCADIHITSDGKYLYASNRGHNSIAAYSVSSSNGELTLINQYLTEPIPREFGLSPNGDYLYAGGEGSGNIAVYSINTDGSLSKLATYTAGTKVTWVLVTRVK